MMNVRALALSLILPLSFANAQEGMLQTPAESTPALPEGFAPMSLIDLSPEAVEYQGAVADWEKLKADQGTVCDPKYDSYEVLTGKKTEYVALVIHGFTLYPRTMDHFVQLFASQGMNVIAPRLARHHTTDLGELASVKKEEWVKETERAYQVARRLGKRVVLVGFSLGGLLSMRLAMAHRDAADPVNGMFLFSPAIRLNPTASAGALLGSTGATYGQYNVPPKVCGELYYSAKAGKQIENLTAEVESTFNIDRGHGGYTTGDASVFFQLKTPLLMATVSTDKSVYTEQVKQIYAGIPSYWKGSIDFEHGEHGIWVDASIMDKIPEDSYRRAHNKPIREEIVQFFEDLKQINSQLEQQASAGGVEKTSADAEVKSR